MDINPKIYKISGNTHTGIFDTYMFAILQDGYSLWMSVQNTNLHKHSQSNYDEASLSLIKKPRPIWRHGIS